MPRRRKRRQRRGLLGLGSPSNVHERMATKALKRVYAALAQVDRAARRNDCNKVMSSMAIVWANYGEAYAHTESMDSSPTQKQYTNNLLGVVQRAERLGDTIVYQCTRKKGGIR